MFIVPTVRFQVLYIFIILGLERRRLLHANVPPNPTAEWLAQQVVNAFPWDTAPRFLIRDRDSAYGLAVSARVRGLGIHEIRTAVRAPLMNAFAERVIGTLRRECFDHLIVLNERHAQRLLGESATGTIRTESTSPWERTYPTIAPRAARAWQGRRPSPSGRSTPSLLPSAA